MEVWNFKKQIIMTKLVLCYGIISTIICLHSQLLSNLKQSWRWSCHGNRESLQVWPSPWFSQWTKLINGAPAAIPMCF